MEKNKENKWPCEKCTVKNPDTCSNWKTCPAYSSWLSAEWERARAMLLPGGGGR